MRRLHEESRVFRKRISEVFRTCGDGGFHGEEVGCKVFKVVL